MAECNTGSTGRLKVYTGNVRTGAGGWYYDFSMYIYNGSSQTFNSNLGWSANASGVGNSGGVNINRAGDFLLWSGTRGPFGWDGNGNTGAAGNSLHMNASGTSGLGGPSDCSESVSFPRVGQAPGAPGMPAASSITPTTATISWTAASRGHADIDTYDFYYKPSGGSQIGPLSGNSLSRALTSLIPGTLYEVYAYAHNSDGWGPQSPIGTFTTLPATPPTLVSVTPDATGTQATVVMTPPSGIASVTSYTVWNRTPGGTWVIAASGSANPTQTISGVIPGQTYEWRVTATIGTYTSPESNVITLTQPQPNTSPGAFFDGSTPDTPTTNYLWTGTAGASTSQAQTLTGGAVGWLSGTEAVVASGGTAVQYQIAGGSEPNGNGGDWSVQYVMLTGASANGFRAGTDGVDGYATVTVGGLYMGSVWVRSSRARDLAAMWVWYNAGGAVIGTTRGVTVSVPTGATRLTVLGQAPALAVRGAVVATDPPGSSMMAAGDTLILDADMASTGTLYPYFDGDTPDTSQFIYDWEGAANSSPSFRESIPQSAQNPLQDPECDPLPVPPAPPAIEDDCIETVGSWRRTWYEVDASNVPEFLAGVPTITLQTFGQAEQQVRMRFYANPDCTAPLDFDSSEWQYEQIISFIPPCTTITLDGVSRRVWAVVGARTGTGTPSDPYTCVPGDYPTIPADSLLHGTGGVPATWPVLTCGICWLVSLDTPLDSTAGNLVVSADMTIRE